MTATKAAMEVIQEEKLAENAFKMGEIFRAKFNEIKDQSDLIADVRGYGLMNAIEVKAGLKVDGLDLCHCLLEEGVFTRATKGTILRFTPPLVITEEEINEVAERVLRGVKKLEALNASRQ